MATQRNFEIKNGLSVAGTERIASNGDITGNHLGTFGGTTVTRSAGTNNTQLASTAYVDVAITNLIDSSPGTLNTLNELAAALGDDASFSTTVTNSIAAKLPLAGGTMSGELNMGSQDITNLDTLASTHFSTSANVNSSGDGGALIPSGKRLGFDQSGTRSWTQYAAGGNLLFASGDGNGAVQANNFTGVTLALTGTSTLNGTITIATGATGGSRTIKDNYSSGALANQGFLRSSGGNYWGYATYLDGSDNWKSASSVALERSVFAIDEDQAYWSHAPSQTVSIGSDLTTQPTKKVVFDLENGRVGIGTDNPSAKLHIHETVSSGTGIMLTNTANTSGTYSDIRWQYSLTDTSYASGIRFKQLNTTHGGQLEFYTDNSVGTYTQQMTITEDGNVGIGIIAPSYKLEVNGQVKSAEGLHSNNWQIYNTGTNGFLIGTNIAANNYAHIHGEIKLQQFNYNTQQIINFSATVAATGVATSAASSDIPVTIKLFMYAGTWYIWVPSPSTYTDISAYIHMGAGYQGTSRSSNAITTLSNAGVPGSGVTNSVDIIAKIATPGSVIQTQHAMNQTVITLSQTINTYSTIVQVNITPKYATSKILITGIAATEVIGGNYPAIHCKIFRDSTEIEYYSYWGYNGPENWHRIIQEPIHFLDSPTTTSALTYYVKITNTSGSAYTGTYGGRGNGYNPSMITVQEIAQ